jgi:DNA repair exonuclease SbcCD ATPase subunit
LADKTMKIQHVSIKNLLGIQELEFDAGNWNAITGKNGQGKTSVLEAIKAAIKGGADATLLRKGAEKGEVVLILDDGTEIKKRVTAKTTTVDVTDPQGKKVTRPSDVIKELTDTLSVNPVEFLRASKKDRVKVLLESMPLPLDAAHLSKISGIPVEPPRADTNALAIIDMVRQQVYDDRTGTNRAIKEKDATINQLRLAMPEAPEGVTGSEDELQAQRDQHQKSYQAEMDRITAKLAGIQSANTTKKEQLRAEAQEKIDKIKADLLADINAIDTEARRIEGLATNQRQKANDTRIEALMPINQALAAIRANRDAAAKREQTQKVIKTMEDDLKDLQADATKQTEAIDAIDAYKEELLASMPIPGIEVRDGEIWRHGINFDRLNTAQQVEIAVNIAEMRVGDLRLVCLDGCELLDSDHLAELEQQTQDAGLQVFVTRVTDGEFSVETK